MSAKKERLKRQVEAAKKKQMEEQLERWREDTDLALADHSVTCYFCSEEFDEREGEDADPYNGGDGGSICPSCLEEQKAT